MSKEKARRWALTLGSVFQKVLAFLPTLRGSTRSSALSGGKKIRTQSFPPFAPEFVIELDQLTVSPAPLDEKMDEYLDNGVQLGWLIDPKLRTVTIYRQGREPEVLSNPTKVVGEGPVEGFVLSLERII